MHLVVGGNIPARGASSELELEQEEVASLCLARWLAGSGKTQTEGLCSSCPHRRAQQFSLRSHHC